MLRKFITSTAGLLGAGALALTLAIGAPAPASAAASAEPSAGVVYQQGPGTQQGKRAGKLITLALFKATIDETGLTRREVVEAVRGGQSLAQVAAANGSSGEAIIQAVVAKAEERFDRQVEAGRITQERADELLQQLAETATTIANNAELGAKLPGRNAP